MADSRDPVPGRTGWDDLDDAAFAARCIREADLIQSQDQYPDGSWTADIVTVTLLRAAGERLLQSGGSDG